MSETMETVATHEAGSGPAAETGAPGSGATGSGTVEAGTDAVDVRPWHGSHAPFEALYQWMVGELAALKAHVRFPEHGGEQSGESQSEHHDGS